MLFDFDHTLGEDHHLELSVLRSLVRKFCAGAPDELELVACLESFRSGRIELDAALIAAFSAWQCIKTELPRIPADFRAAALAQAPLSVTAMPGAAETTQRLARRGVPIAIMTNGWKELQHLKARLIGFPGPVFSSEELGAWKPAPEAFTRVVVLLGLDGPTTLYVGDQPEVDVAGAKSAGLLAAWADLEGKSYPEGVPRPDLTITELSQLDAHHTL